MVDTIRQFKAARQSFGELNAESVGHLLAQTSDVTIITRPDGVIVDLAFGHTDLSLPGSENWVGSNLLDHVALDSRPKVEQMLAEADDGQSARWRQINHPTAGDDIPVQYLAMALEKPRRVLFVGRDLRYLATLQQNLLKSQHAMEADYERYRHAETRYRLLFQITSEALVVVKARTGDIAEANHAASDLLGGGKKDLTGKSLLSFFDKRTRGRIEDMLDEVRTSGQSGEVAARLDDGSLRLVINVSLFTQDQATFFLVRLRPADGVSDLPRSSTAPNRAVQVMDRMPDALVVTDQAGVVLGVNRAFLSLSQLATEQQATGRSLENWLWQPGLGLTALLSMLRQQGSVRQFTTSLRGEFGETTQVEVSAVLLPDEDEPCCGFIIRDIRRRLAQEDDATQGDIKGAARNMTELVGRVSLKDIVREATDVIERLCIEAALDMTNDNRASAAEMLGLSRQSLYVKMRRFGVGESDD